MTSRPRWVLLVTRIIRGTRTLRSGFERSVAATCGVRADVPGVLLDTTVLIDALRGRPAAERLRGLRATGTVPFICAINVEELRRGLRAQEEPAVQRLLDGLRVVPLGAREGQRAGAWRREHASRGITLHQADCLIAAAAVTAGATLATGNTSDFPMREVTVEHWAVGE